MLERIRQNVAIRYVLLLALMMGLAFLLYPAMFPAAYLPSSGHEFEYNCFFMEDALICKYAKITPESVELDVLNLGSEKIFVCGITCDNATTMDDAVIHSGTCKAPIAVIDARKEVTMKGIYPPGCRDASGVVQAGKQYVGKFYFVYYKESTGISRRYVSLGLLNATVSS